MKAALDQLGSAAAKASLAAAASQLSTGEPKQDLAAVAGELGGGRGGAADLVAQMKGARAGGATGPALAGLATTAVSATGAKRPARPRPLTAHQRAAHHIGFKRFMWKPTVGVAALCLLLGIVCLVLPPLLPSGLPPQGGGRIVKDEKGNEIFLDARGEVKQRVAYGPDGKAWFIDPDTTELTWESGRPVAKVSGFDVPVAAASENQDFRAMQHVAAKSGSYFWFGIAFFLVGLPLFGLAWWMRHDVLLVAAREAATGGQGTGANGTKPAAAVAAAQPPASAPSSAAPGSAAAATVTGVTTVPAGSPPAAPPAAPPPDAADSEPPAAT